MRGDLDEDLIDLLTRLTVYRRRRKFASVLHELEWMLRGMLVERGMAKIERRKRD